MDTEDNVKQVFKDEYCEYLLKSECIFNDNLIPDYIMISADTSGGGVKSGFAIFSTDLSKGYLNVSLSLSIYLSIYLFSRLYPLR